MEKHGFLEKESPGLSKKENLYKKKEKTTAKEGGKTLSITYLGLILLFVVFSLIYLFTLFKGL